MGEHARTNVSPRASHEEPYSDKETTPYPSGVPSELDEIEAHYNTPHPVHRISSHDSWPADKDAGAPLEISPSQLSQPPQPGIPDGGFAAWLQVACGFLMFFNSWGLINAFGVWQSFYKTSLIPSTSNSNISWIGSIQAFLLCCTTIFAGPLFDRGHALFVVRSGSFLVIFGMMMTSLCDQYWQLMLAQGLCIGIGCGCLFVTSVALLPSYFTTKRSLAIGIAASGSSLGGVIYPIAFHCLQPQIGFGWATRIVGFIALFTLLLPCAAVRPRALPPLRKKIVDFSGFRELVFCIFCLAGFTGCIGLYIPFFYIGEFSAAKDGLDSELAFYMLPVLSAGSIVGRILPGFVADRAGPLNILCICTVIAGVLGFCWNAIHDTLGGLVIWALLYGAFSGAFVSLQSSSLVSITPHMSIVGGRLGVNAFCMALGVLIGTPIAGVIVGDGSWIGLQLFCGATLLASAALVFVTRWSFAGASLTKKA